MVSVNDKEIPPIAIELAAVTQQGGCISASGQVDAEALGKHFTRGINRFDVQFGTRIAEVILEVEL